MVNNLLDLVRLLFRFLFFSLRRLYVSTFGNFRLPMFTTDKLKSSFKLFNKKGLEVVSLTQLQEIPTKNLILLVGPPGSGKTTFCEETVLKSIMFKPVVYVSTEATSLEISESFRQRGIGEDLPHSMGFVDAFRETVGLPSMTRENTVYASC